MIIASILENSVMTPVSVYVLAAMGVWYFLFCFRHPEFTRKAVKESKMARNENAPVNSEDSAAVLLRLDLMMNTGRLFADDEFSLEKTAALLGEPYRTILEIAFMTGFNSNHLLILHL